MGLKPKPCGHDDCAVSTNIADQISFGRGELDFNGFWEIPCGICAREWEKNHPEDSCWPLAEKETE